MERILRRFAAPRVFTYLLGDEKTEPSFSEMGLFIYDLATLYEIARLSSDPHYESFRFSRFVLYRNGRPLQSIDQMYVNKIRYESPVEITTAIAVYGAAATALASAVWITVQIIEKVYNLRLNRRKLELEVQKLEREAQEPIKEKALIITPEEAMRHLEMAGAAPYAEIVANRLAKSPVYVRDLDITVSKTPPWRPRIK